MEIRIIVLIGVKVQCDLYPSMLSLLAVDSGRRVHIAETAEPINPAINTNNTNSFIINLMAFFINQSITIII